MESIYELSIFHLSAFHSGNGAHKWNANIVSTTAIASLFLIWCLRLLLKPSRKLDFPVVGNPRASDFRSALEEGEAKVGYLPSHHDFQRDNN